MESTAGEQDMPLQSMSIVEAATRAEISDLWGKLRGSHHEHRRNTYSAMLGTGSGRWQSGCTGGQAWCFSKVRVKYESAADSAILKSLELAKRSRRFGKVSQG